MHATTSSLAQKIGFWAATSIVIGSVIGSGVFMKPSSMAAELSSPLWLTIVWVIAGVFSLFGALIYAELGAMFPETGGIYVYFQKMFGGFISYMFGWSAFVVINTAGTAAIAFVCAEYADFFLQLPRFDAATEDSVVLHLPYIGDLFPLKNFGVKSLAIGVMALLTWLNYRSVKAGSSFQLVSTAVKIGVIVLLVVGILGFGNGSFENFIQTDNPKQGGALLGGIIAALTGAFFAYDGWINLTYVAGEIKQPKKNVPKSLWLGVMACMLVYVLVNQAYLYMLPVEEIATSELVAADAIERVFGNIGEALIAGMIIICTLGAVNGNVMCTSRVTYAMAKDRLFMAWAGKEHVRFGTPGNALWLHFTWIAILIITGSFDMLANMMVFNSWLFYGLGAVGVFVLRRKMPARERPYTIAGHPLVTLLFIVFTFFFLISTVYNDILNYVDKRQPVIYSLLGLTITALGIPFYFYYRKKYKG